MKKVKNNKLSADTWAGQQIEPGEYYTIEEHERQRWILSDKVIDDIKSGDLIVANEVEDITDSGQAIAFLKNIQRVGISLVTNNDGSLIDLLSYKVISVHPWRKSRSYTYKNGVIFLEIDKISSGETVDVRLIDTTDASTLGSITITANGFYEFSINKPSLDAGLELQAKTDNSLSDTVIKGVRLEFDSE